MRIENQEDEIEFLMQITVSFNSTSPLHFVLSRFNLTLILSF